MALLRSWQSILLTYNKPEGESRIAVIKTIAYERKKAIGRFLNIASADTIEVM